MNETQEVVPDIEISDSNTSDEIIKILTVFGEINDNTAGTIIPDLLEVEFDKDKKNSIHLYICSEGGLLSACFAIIDFILMLKQQFNVTVYTYGLGEIASGGFFLFLLGDHRYLFPSCKVFVHEHVTINDESKTYGERIHQDKTIEKELYNMYLSYTADQLDLTKRKAKILLKKNKWLSLREIATFNITGEYEDE